VSDRFGALPGAFSAELQRRVRRAFLLALGAGLLAVFALGASILPGALSTDLLLSYALFLATFAGSLALFLLRELGGPFGDALAVAHWARRDAEERRAAVGAGRIPRNHAEARAWLAAHPDPEALQSQRLSAQVMAGDLAAARATLATYPSDTAFDRFERLDDGWFLDYLEGGEPSLATLEEAAAELTDERQRTFAAVIIGTLRAHAAAASGGDWISPLARERPRLGEQAAGFVGSRYVLFTWTVLVAIASGLVGVALTVGRATGVWIGA
jgi:hypothetical protein